MKTFLFLLVLTLSTSIFSQESTAEFPGGQEKMAEYITKYIRFPNQAVKRKINGKCYVKFTVKPDGNVSDVTIAKGIERCPDCDTEAARVIRSMPNWIPGTIDGMPVSSVFVLPIVFKL